MDLQKIGACLRDLRKEKGLTQEQLAERFHVSQRTVSRWETGSVAPDLDVLLQLADFYHVDLRALLNGEKLKKKMSEETKEIVQKMVIFHYEKQKLERGKKTKRIRIWAMVYLIASVLNYLALMVFTWDYLPFGPLSGFYAFSLAAYAELGNVWGSIGVGYFFFIILFTVFAYVITFVKGKGFWFLLLCCVDIAMCLVIFLVTPDFEAGSAQWAGLGVQIFHALLFSIINYVWKRERIRSFAYKAV